MSGLSVRRASSARTGPVIGSCRLGGVLLALTSAAGCPSESAKTDCIGTPAAEGEWKVFAGITGTGQACTTPAGDLHVRYEDQSSDALVQKWSRLIPEQLRLELEQPWRAGNAYRRAIYRKPNRDAVLIAEIVPSAGTPVRTVRLTWDTAPQR